MSNISRRQALIGTLTGSTGLGLTACSSGEPQRFSSDRPAPDGLFAHGVASGDPTTSSVVIWTRISPPENAVRMVRWEVARDEAFSDLAASGAVQTSTARDYTVKVDATGLAAGSSYYYRFITPEGTSPIGRTRTLPEGSVDQVRFAVVSCASWQHGFFNGYDHIARNRDFDAVIHLGDYIYEYGPDGYGAKFAAQIGRFHEPPKEIVSLSDYRTRHGQYKSDPALRAMHAAHPVILLWDDHEVTNNSWEGGAENHQPEEGDWEARRLAAMQAYFEWMPVRDPVPGRPRHHLYKSYKYGDLLRLVTLETRLTQRAEQIDVDKYLADSRGPEDAQKLKEDLLGAPDRYMLGDAQLDFVVEELSASRKAGERWRLLANQVLMAKVNTPDLNPYVSEDVLQLIEKDWAGIRSFVKSSAYALPLYADTWSGYPWARERLYDRLAEAGVNDLLVITGDAHEFWANDLYRDNGEKMGVELGTTSITSQTVEEYLGDGTKGYALLVTRENDEVRYYDPQTKGYIDLTIGVDGARADFVGLSTVMAKDYTATTTARFALAPKNDSVSFNGASKLGLKERFLYQGWG